MVNLLILNSPFDPGKIRNTVVVSNEGKAKINKRMNKTIFVIKFRFLIFKLILQQTKEYFIWIYSVRESRIEKVN